VETTLFHPVFAYEMLWNLITAPALLWAARRYPQYFKPGAVFGWWLVLAGVGRTFIEFFRPDQPQIGGSFVTTSMLFSALMALAGVFFLLGRYGKIRLPGIRFPQKYHLAPPIQR
jgi:prolipoprotein diacylglyceryltransferase